MFESDTYKRARIATVVGCTVIAAVSLLGDAPRAEADLINPAAADNALVFVGRVDDTALGAAVVGGVSPAGNWFVVAAQLTIDGVGANNDIAVWGQHLVAPHAGEPAPNPNIVIGAFLNVVPGAAGALLFRNSVEHPGVPQFNNLRITYAQLVAGVSSRLTIDIEHSEDQGTQDELPSGVPSQPPTPDEGWKGGKQIPTVSEWGMMVMGLLLFTVATIVIRRGRRAA
ncbi:MAG: hypothetical protein V3W34_20715 [Phycisphaerae bacterium]